MQIYFKNYFTFGEENTFNIQSEWTKPQKEAFLFKIEKILASSVTYFIAVQP